MIIIPLFLSEIFFCPFRLLHIFKFTSDQILSLKQTPWTQGEQSDLGPYCLQYRLPMKVVTGGRRVKTD